MPTQLLATCWTHAGDALPVAGRHLSPLDLRARAEAVAAAGFTGIGFTIDDLEAAAGSYGLQRCSGSVMTSAWSTSRSSCSRTGGPPAVAVASLIGPGGRC